MSAEPLKGPENRITAVLLAGGRGSRMGTSVRKQYLLLEGRPVLSYSLEVLLNSELITDVVIVAGQGDESYVRENILLPFGKAADKVRAVVPGGKERFDSVCRGVEAVNWPCGYFFIHDGARPFLTGEMLERLASRVMMSGACIAAVPSKDTVKIADEEGMVKETPDRRNVWNVQTPQCFDAQTFRKALSAAEETPEPHGFTDDSQVVELFTDWRVQVVMGDYRNIKITTPEDIPTAEAFLRGKAEETR